MEKLYRNILLPVDGSQQSIDAFKTGVRIAKSLGSDVYLVQVIKDEKNVNLEDRESFLNALKTYARREGLLSLHSEIVYGEPREQIADELVKRWNIDLIVMGATGKGRVAKVMIGSVTNYVLGFTKADVLISR